MFLNSDKAQVNSDHEDSDASIELTEEDKDYIKEIMIRHKIKGSDYNKYRPCRVCDKIRLSSNPENTSSFFDIFFMEHENDFAFTKEKRRKIIQSVVHEFFESKEKKERGRDQKINFYSRSTKISKVRHKYVVKKTAVSSVKKNVRTSAIKSFESYERRPQECTTTPRVISTRPPMTRTNRIHSEGKQYHTKNAKMLLLTANAKTPLVGDSDSPDVASLTRTGASKVNHSCKEKDLFKPPAAVQKNISKKNQFNSPEEIEQSQKFPMYDPKSPFYIPADYMNTALYQDGLALREWNPTQALYEISGYCDWGKPEFLVGGNGYTGFLSCVRVRGYDFMGDIRGKTKKIAMHLASTKFLNHIGFKFGPDTSKVKF